MRRVFISGQEVTTVAFDVDGVLLNSDSQLICFLNREKGFHLKKTDFTSFQYPQILGLSLTETRRLITEFHDSSYHLDLKPMPGAVETVRFLAKQGIQMPVVTSRPERHKALTQANLERYFGGLLTQVHLSGNPFGGFGNGHGSKGEVCKGLGVDLMVEDVPDYALDCVRYGISVALVKPPYNVERANHPLIIPFDDLHGFRETIYIR